MEWMEPEWKEWTWNEWNGMIGQWIWMDGSTDRMDNWMILVTRAPMMAVNLQTFILSHWR